MIPLSQPLSFRRHARRGMTLVEILIAGSIAVAVSGFALWFVIESTRTSLRTVANVDNDLEQWSISNRLQIDSKIANGVVVYENFSVAAFGAGPTGMPLGSRGNCLVLSHSEQDSGTYESTYKKITGYVFNPTTETLSKFEMETVPTKYQTVGSPTQLDDILIGEFNAITLKVIARNVSSINRDNVASTPEEKRVFLCRDPGSQASLVLRRSSGKAIGRTQDFRMFEIAFYTRP